MTHDFFGDAGSRPESLAALGRIGAAVATAQGGETLAAVTETEVRT